MANFTTKKDVSIPWGQGILKYPKINKCANFCQGQVIQSFKTAVSQFSQYLP